MLNTYDEAWSKYNTVALVNPSLLSSVDDKFACESVVKFINDQNFVSSKEMFKGFTHRKMNNFIVRVRKIWSNIEDETKKLVGGGGDKSEKNVHLTEIHKQGLFAKYMLEKKFGECYAHCALAMIYLKNNGYTGTIDSLSIGVDDDDENVLSFDGQEVTISQHHLLYLSK